MASGGGGGGIMLTLKSYKDNGRNMLTCMCTHVTYYIHTVSLSIRLLNLVTSGKGVGIVGRQIPTNDSGALLSVIKIVIVVWRLGGVHWGGGAKILQKIMAPFSLIVIKIVCDVGRGGGAIIYTTDNDTQARQTRPDLGGVAEGQPRFDKGGVAIIVFLFMR